eukprot:364721-Chlamydomonas_euryale.AAC.20
MPCAVRRPAASAVHIFSAEAALACDSGCGSCDPWFACETRPPPCPIASHVASSPAAPLWHTLNSAALAHIEQRRSCTH